MVYKVIGLMSGSSMDGLDIVYTQLEEVRGAWTFEIIHADCIPYTEEWVNSLEYIATKSVPEFLRLDTAYGRYLGEQVKRFIDKYDIEHKVHFIASHGHTIMHEPKQQTTCQIGNGAMIAAIIGLPVIDNLRVLDVALGGQGAPIVPIGDKLLFGNYEYCLNIGGICNITIQSQGKLLAFDVCPANQVLNRLAKNEGKDMDEDGAIAAEGNILLDVLTELNDRQYYKQTGPKSLGNEEARELVFPILLESGHSNADMLRTMVEHIADQVAAVVKLQPAHEDAHMLVTGGGAFNKFLMEQLHKALLPLNVTVTIPDESIIKYKEGLVMALIGALRWREENTVLSHVTGAAKDSVGGTIWMGQGYNGG
ncbi:MAG: anhydro-N-acetylmuramic acid kinase [Flavipsychrobacter sp.]|nr:anhydro-N-acetylmuramic acid kinase [Flavipsychrobacter sp.]